jgi:predicted ATPase/class 3 adenylate cyclase
MEQAAPRSLPTGTVSFLFSDVEGSTARWESHRDAMQAAMRRHDAIFAQVVAARGGSVFKTIGDAFCVAFATAPAAIGAALEIQHAVAAEDWSSVDGLRVRMAVHTGDADERDGDYFGPVVNRVARLLATGHGGQVLVSGVAADLSQGALPPQTALRDLGSHRLRDLAYPEQVYQLTGGGLDATFPPLRTLDALPNNLPLQLTSFLGREDEVAEIRALVERSRLVTLVGAGGVGKTRTSLQVAAELLDRFPDGVWFVELAPLRDASVIETVVLSVMGVANTSVSATSPFDILKGRRALLVFDNCEHLVHDAAAVIDRLLRTCAHISVIASSREGLGIGGEVVFRMPSLAVPPDRRTLTAEEARAFGAIALFVDRAQALDRDFELTDDNATVVGEICRQLDGIALAIELAAPRIKLLSPRALLERLTERFRLLTGGSRAALPRQQTMRALIDWSYDLLTEAEQRVFRRVSVFAGGWTLEAATAVCTDAEVEEWDLLDLLGALVDKSLIVTERTGDEQRYRMLESTRQYARERLTQSAEQQRFLRRHAEYVAQFHAAINDARWRTPLLATRRRLEAERDNTRAALTWTLIDGFDPQLGIRIVGLGLATFTDASAEALRWYALAEAALDDMTSPTERARLLLASASQGDSFPAEATLARGRAAAELFRALGDQMNLACVLGTVARSLGFLGRPAEALPIVEEALRIVGSLNLPLLRVYLLQSLSLVLAEAADRISALEEAKAICEAQGDDLRLIGTLIWLAEDEYANGLVARALSRARDALARQREVEPRGRGMSMLCSNIAAYSLANGDVDSAYCAARDALRIAIDTSATVTTTMTPMLHLATCAQRRGHHESSARLLGYTRTGFDQAGRPMEFTEQSEFDGTRAALVEALGEERFSQLYATGASLTEDMAVAEAFAV